MALTRIKAAHTHLQKVQENFNIRIFFIVHIIPRVRNGHVMGFSTVLSLKCTNEDNVPLKSHFLRLYMQIVHNLSGRDI